jgi:hypothetical protein
MKRIYTLIILIILCLSNQACTEEDYSDEKFETSIDQKLALLKYAKQAQESTGAKRKKYIIKYFKAFPSDFGSLFKLRFGKHYYNHDPNKRQLNQLEEDIFYGSFYGDTLYIGTNDYDEKYFSNPWGTFNPTIKYVKSVEEIPQEPISLRFQEVYDNMKTYYKAYYDAMDMLLEEIPKVIPQEVAGKKVISRLIGGGGGFYIDMLFVFVLGGPDRNEPLFIKLLEERTDDEIASYYYYIYVDSHILITEYQEDYEHTKALSPRVAAQMQRAYERVLQDGACCCGH